VSGGGVVAGIDVGTTKIELDVYDEAGSLVLRSTRANKTLSDGLRAEQDPKALLSSVKGLLDEARKAGARCVGIAAYRGSLVVWSREGSPVTNIITWMDLRPYKLWGRLPLGLRLASRLPRIGQALSPESMAVRLAVLLAEDPSLARGLAEGSLMAWNIDAYIAYNLTGSYAADSSTAALTGLIHPATLKPINLVFAAARLPRLRIPRLLPHEGLDPLPLKGGGELGSLVGDQQAASVALDCLESGCLKIAMGTGLFLDYPTGDRLLLSPGKGLLPLILLRGRNRVIYGVEAYLPGLGKFVEWFVNSLLNGSYEAIDAGIAESSGRPPLVLPFMWGSRLPRLRGGLAGILGLAPHHGRGDLAAGLAHSIAALTSLLERSLAGILGEPRSIIVTGGLTRLRRLLELVATYLERPIYLARTPGSASALGAAMLAARNCGVQFNPNVEVVRVDPGSYNKAVDPEIIAGSALKLSSALVGCTSSASRQSW